MTSYQNVNCYVAGCFKNIEVQNIMKLQVKCQVIFRSYADIFPLFSVVNRYNHLLSTTTQIFRHFGNSYLLQSGR